MLHFLIKIPQIPINNAENNKTKIGIHPFRPAFDNILPALFGGLAVVYVSKNWKIAIAPLVFMVVLFLLVPSLSGSVGVLVPVGALIAIGSARVLYKKGKL